MRHIVYRHDEHGLADDAAVEAWGALAPYLRVGPQLGATDSPVDAVMQIEQWGVVKRRATQEQPWDALRERLALARDLADGDLMLEVLGQADGVRDEALDLLRAEAGVGLVRLGRYADAVRLLRGVVEGDPGVLRPDAHTYYAQALYRSRDAGIEDCDAAERVLKRVLVQRPGHPEVRAMLGAIAKRRMRLRKRAEEREPDLRLAMESYAHDYERNLNAFYEGINVVAMAAALHLAYGDERAGAKARELVPAVRVAATLALRTNPGDYWAAATLAECALHEALLGLPAPAVRDAYREAAALRPPRGDLDSTRFQLEFLEFVGLPAATLAEAREGLLLL